LNLESEKYKKLFITSHVDIEKAINALNTSDNRYVIFERSETHYMQGAIVAENEIRVEYQNGDLEKHYQSINTIDRDSFSEMVRLYRAKKRKWRTLATWKKLPFKKKKQLKVLIEPLYLLLVIVCNLLLYMYGENWFGISKSTWTLNFLVLAILPLYPSSLIRLLEDDSSTFYYNIYTWQFVIFTPIVLLFAIWITLMEIN
jgi:hypothetical protein